VTHGRIRLFKRENPEKQIDGLRPPQIRSIFAVQAHWTVNADPATVVLPRGVGKTETMLSVLIVERCPHLMVVVPTNPLKIQISEKFVQLGFLKESRFQVVGEKAQYPLDHPVRAFPTESRQLSIASFIIHYLG